MHAPCIMCELQVCICLANFTRNEPLEGVLKKKLKLPTVACLSGCGLLLLPLRLALSGCGLLLLRSGCKPGLSYTQLSYMRRDMACHTCNYEAETARANHLWPAAAAVLLLLRYFGGMLSYEFCTTHVSLLDWAEQGSNKPCSLIVCTHSVC